MGSRMKNQAKEEESRIESKRGFVYQFLKQRKEMLEEKEIKKQENDKSIKNEMLEEKEKVQDGTESDAKDEKKDETKENAKSETKNDKREMKEEKENGKHENEKEEEKGDALLQELVLTMLELIEKEAPISQDLLFLCWKYEETAKTNRLWKALQIKIEEALDNSKNKKKWIWFKTYIFDSMVCLALCFFPFCFL